MLDRLTSRDFSSHVGEPFAVTAPDGERLDFVLTEVGEHGAAPPGAARTPFFVLWRGPGHRLLPQGTYPVEHAGLGRLDLFIVPIAKEADGYRYEAVFS